MNVEEARLFCLSLPQSTEGMPFGDQTLVFKVKGKMFALMGLEKESPTMNLKCDPERALELRDAYSEDIVPGWHMNKKHWNTVALESSHYSNAFIEDLIRHSFELVVDKLPKKDQLALRKS